MKEIKLNLKAYQTKETEDLLGKELLALKNDELVYPEIKKLNLTNREAEMFIASLIDFKDDIHYCSNCPGLDHCVKPHPHFCLKLEKEGNVLTRHYDPCEKMISLVSFRERYIRCSFPEEWRDNDLRDIQLSAVSRNQVVDDMLNILSGNEAWPYLIGHTGSGRSFILACFANMITKQKGKGAFVNTADFLSEMKEMSINNRDAFEQLMREMCSASVLVLDDFGNEYQSEYVYTTILFPILSARDRAGLITCFASEFPIKQIVSMYKPKIGEEKSAQLGRMLNRRCGRVRDVSSFPAH